MYINYNSKLSFNMSLPALIGNLIDMFVQLSRIPRMVLISFSLNEKATTTFHFLRARRAETLKAFLESLHPFDEEFHNIVTCVTSDTQGNIHTRSDEFHSPIIVCRLLQVTHPPDL